MRLRAGDRGYDTRRTSSAPARAGTTAKSTEAETSQMSMIADPAETLTPRQLEYLALYASGKELREIASIKFVSYAAVQKCLGEAKERVGAANLTHLCVLAVESGVIRKNGVGYKPVQDERVVGE